MTTCSSTAVALSTTSAEIVTVNSPFSATVTRNWLRPMCAVSNRTDWSPDSVLVTTFRPLPVGRPIQARGSVP